MSLKLIPNNDLVFKGPFNVVSTTTLKLFNSGNERLAYKIKTTAPKRYCVKPNSGFLEPHNTASVQVMLQPQAAGQEDDRSKHKFMVQWIDAPSNFDEDVENFWKQDLSKLNVHDSKLKCVFTEDQPAGVVPTDTSGHKDSDPTSTRLDVTDDSSKLLLTQELDRLKVENENLKEQLKQQEVRKRNTGSERVDNPVIDRLQANQRPKEQGVVLFGVAFSEQLALVAFVIALLFGFSLGYFLFSCGN